MAIDPTEPIECIDKDFERFGKLIKKWAEGEGSIPTDTDEIKDRLYARGIVIPDRIKTINIVFDNTETLTIVVPPIEMIEKGEEIVTQAVNYPLPDEYKKQVNSENDRKRPKPFQKFRIGEYCVGQCL